MLPYFLIGLSLALIQAPAPDSPGVTDGAKLFTADAVARRTSRLTQSIARPVGKCGWRPWRLSRGRT